MIERTNNGAWGEVCPIYSLLAIRVRSYTTLNTSNSTSLS